jgi:16S rRNA (cytosine967-C5)-methyltransferase
MTRQRLAPRSEAPGLPARRIAADILDGVLRRGLSLDEQLDGAQAHIGLRALSDRDRALVRRLVATALRRLGSLRHLINGVLERGLPADAPRVETALLIGAVQILLLDTPDHAAVDLSVRLVQADRRAGRYAGLVNAVLRRLAQDGAARLAQIEALALDTPAWLMARWASTYGETTARAIAAAIAQEPSLDVTVKQDPEFWASRLRGKVLPTGTVRTVAHGPVSALPGYAEGAWWVQDAAAALPVRLLGDVRGRRVGDLCAAPGGKAMQLALAGADVTAVDRSPARVARLRENLRRVKLAATIVTADIGEWQTEPFDAVLIDAPCSSTGTIRRHPDIPWRRRPEDIQKLAGSQRRLLDRAVDLVKPGGTIVYCTCSLEPEEGESLVAALLASDARLRRASIGPAELFGLAELLTPEGELRTLPCHFPDSDSRMSGLDGFYAVRLQRV